MNDTMIKESIKEQYGAVAKSGGVRSKQQSSCCGDPSAPETGCGCGTSSVDSSSKGIGYNDDELGAVPEGANLGLGCGNPTGLALIREGDTVLDLGSGGGFDSFLAANRVGKTGRVIGVDMTPEMIEKATGNASKGGYDNVEFRLGEIESLPVEDGLVDLIISNCVVNLSTDKGKTFQEAYRVLKPGGRVTISDIVLLKELPPAVQESIAAYTGCVSGALLKEVYLQTIKEAGFEDIKITREQSFGPDVVASFTGEEYQHEIAASIQSITVSATKRLIPGTRS